MEQNFIYDDVLVPETPPLCENNSPNLETTHQSTDNDALSCPPYTLDCPSKREIHIDEQITVQCHV